MSGLKPTTQEERELFKKYQSHVNTSFAIRRIAEEVICRRKLNITVDEYLQRCQDPKYIGKE